MSERLAVLVSGELPAKTQVQDEGKNLFKRSSGFLVEESSRCGCRLQSCGGGSLVRTSAERSGPSQRNDRSDGAFFKVDLAVVTADPAEKSQRRPKLERCPNHVR